MRKAYPSDLSDDQWALIEPLIPINTTGRPRKVDMREVFNAILYINRSGCQWDMLPHDFPAKSTVYDHFAQWRDDGTWQQMMDALRRQVRQAAGHEPEPRTACIDSQTVKGTEVGGERGYDGGKKIRGREAAYRGGQPGFAAGGDDHGRVAGRRDGGSRGAGPLDGGSSEPAGGGPGRHEVPQPRPGCLAGGHGVRYVVEVIERPPGSEGYVKLPKRWVVERTFAWIGRCRRNSRDYELYPHSSEAFIKIGSIHLMLRRLQPDESRPSPPFKYRKNQEIITG